MEQAIRAAESSTSAEIRVHIEDKLAVDARDRAAFIFEKLGMHATDARNGVLVYIAVESRKFAIIGDVGIHQFVQDAYWESCAEILTEHFKRAEFKGGIVSVIAHIAQPLSIHFPRKNNDQNELSDTISFGQ